MPIAASFSQFRQNFKKGADKDFVKQCYEAYIFCILAKDPGFRWGSECKLSVAVEVRKEGSAFALGKEFKEIRIRFGKIQNWDEVLSW